MPGSVASAVPTTVLPQSLSRSFDHEREFPVVGNEYRNGESQRLFLAASSRKRWRQAKRLTAAQMATLRSFYLARKGPQEPFYIYDPWDTSPKFSWDATGVATVGRYTVRFGGAFEQVMAIGRGEVSIEMIEIA